MEVDRERNSKGPMVKFMYGLGQQNPDAKDEENMIAMVFDQVGDGFMS